MFRILALLLLISTPNTLADSPRVRVNGETLLGFQHGDTGVATFLGVPFAEAPIGALRWQAPRPHRGKGQERDARQFAPACMQTPRIVEWYRDLAETFGASRDVVADLPISEDCLYLNVWTPRLDDDAKLPVMVYIHGGSNKSGWSWEANYHGHALAARGVVVISIAYRLGAFGYFSHPALTGNQAEANFGIWDQLAALRWIQSHIDRFGGDPDRVTVFGESAGGQNIAVLLLSKHSEGLMHRAVLQSTPDFGLGGMPTIAQEQARGSRFAESIAGDSESPLDTLRSLPAGQLLDAATTAFADYYHMPVLDGQLLERPVREILDSGDFPVTEVMIGSNADEWYASSPADADATTLDAAIDTSRLPDKPALRATLADGTDARVALDRLRTAERMLCPSQYFAARLAGAGREVWMYWFSRVRDGDGGKFWRAYHGAEYPYVFDTHDSWLTTTAVDRRLTGQMMSYWVRFAAAGNPNSDVTPAWPAYRSPDYRVQELGDQVRGIDAPEPVLCKLYQQMIDQVPQSK